MIHAQYLLFLEKWIAMQLIKKLHTFKKPEVPLLQNPSLDCNLSQLNPVHNLAPFSKFLSSHIHLDLPRGLFPSDVPTKIFMHL
jgi:hypothetical protein